MRDDGDRFDSVAIAPAWAEIMAFLHPVFV